MKTKLFTLLLAVAASVGTMFASTKIGDLYYNLDATSQTAEVTSQSSSSPYWWSTTITTAIIPASVEYSLVWYSVTSIGDRAFYHCDRLTSVTIPNSVTSIGYEAFENCTGLTSVTIPNSVTSIGSGAFGYCRGLTSVTIPNSVTSIGNEAFSGCTGLTSVTIPNSVTSIGWGAYCNCTGLTSINIPDNVTSINAWTFKGCTSLKSIKIPSNVKTLGDSAFAYCSKMAEIIIPASVTSIGKGAFKYGNRLQKIVFGENVETIETGAFANCPYLLEVYAKMEFPPVIDASVFEGCGDLSGIDCYVPEASMALYKKAAVWKEFKLHPLEIKYVSVQASATNGIVDGIGNHEMYSNAVLTVIPNDCYSFKQWSDGDLSNPRTVFVTQDTVLNAICEPIPAKSLPYNEPFTSNIGSFTIENVNLDGLSYVWTWASANYGMKASAYVKNTNHATESWLISPAISLENATDIVLAFEHAVNKGTTNNLQVKITTNSGVSWSDLNVPNWPAGTNWNFVSTSLSLDTYANKIVQIAFVYKSTSSDCATWEVKNFSVTGTVHQPTAVEMIFEDSHNSSTSKILCNGQIFILRGDKTYTLQGQEVK